MQSVMNGRSMNARLFFKQNNLIIFWIKSVKHAFCWFDSKINDWKNLVWKNEIEKTAKKKVFVEKKKRPQNVSIDI